jgi:non-homologous end joining protein Ku
VEEIADAAPAGRGNVIDLVEALRRSVKENSGKASVAPKTSGPRPAAARKRRAG